MSWYSKIAWAEGLFLRQHHMQQADRYAAHLLESRVGHLAPYPWGFSLLEIDKDLGQQNKFGLRRAIGVMQDGLPFDMPSSSPLPATVDIPPGSERQFAWLTLPVSTANSREFGMRDDPDGTRYVKHLETVVDSESSAHVEEEIEVAHPRLSLEIRPNPKQGHHCLKLARILEVRDRAVVLDETFAPPVLLTGAHPVVAGWLERVIGWVETRLDVLARYAADATSGGGLHAFDYYMLQMLNREINGLLHLRGSRYVHPERVYDVLVGIAGELATFSPTRRATTYKAYDHDMLAETFSPVLSDIQYFLSLENDRAVRLELRKHGTNAFVAAVKDRDLFRSATFVLDVYAERPLSEIQMQFPAQCKIGPGTMMNQIVQALLPGIQLVHLPAPPRQIRTLTDHVYFQLDKSHPLWKEFSTAPSMGLHLSGDWKGIALDLWAVKDARK